MCVVSFSDVRTAPRSRAQFLHIPEARPIGSSQHIDRAGTFTGCWFAAGGRLGAAGGTRIGRDRKGKGASSGSPNDRGFRFFRSRRHAAHLALCGWLRTYFEQSVHALIPSFGPLSFQSRPLHVRRLPISLSTHAGVYPLPLDPRPRTPIFSPSIPSSSLEQKSLLFLQFSSSTAPACRRGHPPAGRPARPSPGRTARPYGRRGGWSLRRGAPPAPRARGHAAPRSPSGSCCAIITFKWMWGRLLGGNQQRAMTTAAAVSQSVSH